MTQPRVVTDEEAAEWRKQVDRPPRTEEGLIVTEMRLCALLDHREALMRALEAVGARGDRINEALGYEFIGEYVEPLLSLSHGGE